jgi:SAM-dependent methyltransferase
MTERVRVPELLAARARGDLATEDRFFANLRLRNGVYKLTHRNRFDDTLSITAMHARRIGARRVLDVACSSGISTVELARAIDAEVHGTDVMTSATYLERDGIGWLVDRDDRVIQVDDRDGAMSWSPSKRDIAMHPIRVARSLAHRAARRRAGAFTRTPVSLVSSLVAGSGVTMHEEDALRPQLPGMFDLVRVANFMNLGYWATRQLEDLRAAIVPRVSDGGLLFVLRTHGDGTNHGSFFEKRGSRMIELERFGSGSEVAAIIKG